MLFNEMSNKWLTLKLLLFFMVLGGGSYSFYSTEQHLDVYQRTFIGWASFFIIYFIYKSTWTKDTPPHSYKRIFFILLSAFLSIRYILWRTYETLYYTGPLDFIALALLYLAECHAITLHLFSMFINIWPLNRGLDPVALDSPNLPTVDIFIPAYTEGEEIIKTTVTAAKNINYPADKFRVFILDDGSTHARRNNPKLAEEAWERYYSLRRMARQLGVEYLTRETNKHAKAGNINHALTKSTGELVMVLDCDHVPTKDILENTVGEFLKNDKVYLVQTPHFFINPTPVEKQLEGVANISVENDMFFRLIHPGLDFWNSSYFCGSAALLRRKHLDIVGGLSTKTITEDAETSIILHDKGLESVFVNHPMVCGLSPETFSDYVTQRTRWAQGMLQLFLFMNVLRFKGLTLAQKMSYFNSSFFWFFGLSRFMFYIAPTLYLIFGMKVYHATLDQIVAYAVPYVLSTIMVMDFFFGKVRKPFFSEIYESVQALFLIPAVISVFLNPKRPTFKITPKGSMVSNVSLNPLAAPFFIVVLINVLSLPMAVYTWLHYPLFRDVVIVTSVWCVFNIFLALVSLGAFWEKKQVRRHHRIKVHGRASIFFPRMNETLPAEVKDISLQGVSVAVKAPFQIIMNEDMVVTVWDSYGESFVFETQRRRAFPIGDKLLCGTEIVNHERDFEKAVRFVYGDSRRWLENWTRKSRPGGTGRLLIGFLRLGVQAEKEIFISFVLAGWSFIKEKVKLLTPLKEAKALAK